MCKWKKRGTYETLDDYVKHHTGMSIDEMTDADGKIYRIRNLEKVATRLRQASKNQEFVGIVGDYDSDGANSLNILSWLMVMLKIPFSVTIPKRMTEGYGLSPKIMERMENVKILLTVDNGIKAMEAINIAKTKGMEVIVLDHHQAEKDQNGNPILPNADIIIDPEALPEGCDYIHYCGAGLSYKLAELILGNNHPFLPVLSAYAAIGTIGDSVELLGDNRVIVKKGMAAISKGYCTSGLLKLIKRSKLNEGSSAVDISFNLVPAINAPGRLFDDGTKMVVQGLFSNSNNEAEDELIERLLEINTTRKSLVENCLSEIDIDAYRVNNEHVIFYMNENVPEGILGIVAGQISQGTGKPVLAMTKTEDGKWKGSARSQSDNYSLAEIMGKNSHLFVKFGGHPKAAGFTLEEKYIEELKMNMENMIPLEFFDDSIYYDLDIPAARMSSVAKQILSMEPYGEGLPTVVVRVKGRLDKKTGDGFALLGENKEHIKFKFKGFDAVGFFMAEKFTDTSKQFIDMVGTLGWNVWKGKRTLQLNLIDFKVF